MPQPKATIFIFMGLIASGKSTLAQAFADKWQFEYYNSDVERKKLASLDPATRGNADFAKGIYTAAFSRLTYDTLIAKAQEQVDQSSSVVIDGSYSKQSERQNFTQALSGDDAQLFFILCEVPEQLTKERLQLRALDPQAVSDGTYDVYLRQRQGFEYPDELDPAAFISIETNGDVEQLLTTLESSLNIPPFSS